MQKQKLSTYLSILTAVLGSSFLAGCGGSSSSISNTQPPPVKTTGGVASTPATGPSTPVTASNTAQTITVSVNGTPTQVVLPANTALPANANLAIIPAGTTFLNGLTLGGSFDGHKFTPAQSGGGNIFINGLPSGVTVSANGQISVSIGMPPGSWSMSVPGPFTVRSGNTRLTVREFDFTFESNGTVLSIPTQMTLAIPANGATWSQSDSASATFDPAYGTGPATLEIDDTQGTLTQTQPVSGNSATFSLRSAAHTSQQIPAGGVNNVKFTH